MAAHQSSIESVSGEAAGAEALLALAHRLTTLLFFFSTTISPLVLFLPVLEDFVDVTDGLWFLLILLIILLLIQVLVDLIHKVKVERPHVLVRLECFLLIAELFMAVPSIAITAPTMATTVNVTKALSSVHEGFVSVA